MIAKLKQVLRPRQRWERLTLAMNKTIGIPRFASWCPVCESPVRKWRPLMRDVGGGEFRAEAEGRICPYCKSMERMRHFWLYARKVELFKDRPRLLHFAPEACLKDRLRAILAENYVTTDLMRKDVDFQEDITKMSFPNESFDMVYCSNVLEHVPDDRAAMSELFRVLKPGGLAIVQVPIKGDTTYEDDSITDPRDRMKHFGQGDHVRYYGRDVTGRLEATGFEVEEFAIVDRLGLPMEEQVRMNIVQKEPLHWCRKPGSGN